MATTEPLLAWEPPLIQPHRVGEINKFGRRPRDKNVTRVFDVDIEALKAKYGSPLFVTSEAKLRGNIRRIKRAFEVRYGNVSHGYSYKTNYISAICNILHQEGSLAEVVSAFEYEKARLLGVPGERIIFNGPNKGRAILERAIAEGAMINIDHLDELQLIEAVAKEQGRLATVSLRLNFETGFTEPWSRFGFNLESGQAHQAAKLAVLSPHIRLKGLHSHIGTFILEPRAYQEQVKIMCKFMRDLESREDVCIDTIDIGGGLPSRNALQGIYLPPEQVVPSISEYAEAICTTLTDETLYRSSTNRPLPKLVLESGRAVVDDAQSLIVTVAGTKRLPDGRQAAILDAGTNLLFTAYWYNHQVELVTPPRGPPEETVLYGPLCMNIDVVRSSVQLPPLQVGDTMVISPTGAYNNTQWMQFIEYRPNVVLVHEDGDVSVIREAENLQSMVAHDRLPDHLRRPEAVR
ncbi:MAG: alanine racemase [Cyanobacteria bacterium SZAS LIN-3]|nr:alanine racemase [Cyanobacteria bacterium SZAS LIN-3]